MQNSNRMWTWIIVIIIIAVLAFIFWGSIDQKNNTTIVPSTEDTFDQSISDGTIKALYSSEDFGLATSPAQILVQSTVPPCDSSFNYCIYYKGTAYQGTNFESAGVRIQKRTDLKTENACLSTPPSGYATSTMPDSTKPGTEVSSSVFKDLGNSGAGHIVTDSVYRLFYKTTPTCYEFETRVAHTDFGNYPQGSIQEFTQADENALNERLQSMLANVSINNNSGDVFP